MRTHHPIAHRRQAHGLVLVVALILMAVIGVSSAAAIRLALTGSIISMGLRANSEAMQAAEAGLRWCERETRLSASELAATDPSFVLRTPPSDVPELWTTLVTFQANAFTVPRAVLASAGIVNLTQMPQCLAERRPPSPGLENTKAFRTFVITVRGFSSDYRRAVQGEDSGAEVWLQSNMRWVN